MKDYRNLSIFTIFIFATLLRRRRIVVVDEHEKILSTISTYKQVRWSSNGKKNLPFSFSFDRKYPHCSKTSENIGNCWSCFASTPLNVISDRTCKYETENGEFLKYKKFSTQEIISCLKGECNRYYKKGGFKRIKHKKGCCNGFFVQRTFSYVKKRGISSERCMKYEGNGEIVCPRKGSFMGNMFRRSVKCPDHPKLDFRKERKYIKGYKTFVEENEFRSDYSIRRLMEEIYFHGPITASILISENFKNYTYDSVFDPEIEGKYKHSVEIIGWGFEKELGNYWICKNVWGREFGLNGKFKLRRDNSVKLSAVFAPIVGEEKMSGRIPHFMYFVIIMIGIGYYFKYERKFTRGRRKRKRSPTEAEMKKRKMMDKTKM